MYIKSFQKFAIFACLNSNDRGVAQLVARYVRDVEAAGSSPVTPTITKQDVLFCLCS